MKWAGIVLIVLVAPGCNKFAESMHGAAGAHHRGPQASAGQEPEEFEGTVDLFGKKVRARRQVMLDADGNYVKQGRSIAWYENGQKAGQMWYENDKPNGPEYSWHENGKKKMHGQSTGGLATGRWTEWYDNGQKQSEGEYVDGERHGLWTFWGPSGQVVENVEYRYGKKVSVAENARGFER